MLADALEGRGAQVVHVLGPGRVEAHSSTPRRDPRRGVGSSTASRRYSTVKPLRFTGSGGPAILSTAAVVVAPV
jgi:hypothetical protein